MLKHFNYTKESGDVSTRAVYPLRLVDDKVLAIDMSDMSDSEREESIRILDKIHRTYLDEIYNAGFKGKFRSFFLDRMS